MPLRKKGSDSSRRWRQRLQRIRDIRVIRSDGRNEGMGRRKGKKNNYPWIEERKLQVLGTTAGTLEMRDLLRRAKTW